MAELTVLGATVQLAAEVRDQNAGVMAGVTVTWSSSEPSVATTDTSGLVTGVGEGEATITASAGSVSGFAVVTVMQTVARVEVTPPADTIGLGSMLELTAKGFDENGDAVEGAEFSWESSDVAIATVDASGLVTGVAVGTVTITASAGSGEGRAQVTVANLERPALVAFYEAADGSNWVNNENWLTDAPLGEWFGVDTDASGRVVRLDLGGRFQDGEYVTQGLRGVIAPELGALTHLTLLDLDGNDIGGSIPVEFANLANLRVLDLRWNDLTGPIPPELGNLGKLEALEIYGNNLPGPIPAELGNLSSLRDLNLGENRLTGSIPRELGDLPNLTDLYLGHNQLTGEIPAELGKPTGLRSLILSRNYLSGPIPETFLELDALEAFEFGSNADLCAPGTNEFVTWLEGVGEISGPSCNESDIMVLGLLYQTTGGPNWTNSTRWLETPALEEWYGVTADALGRVVALDLAGNGLEGRLPAGLGSLAEMTALSVGDNALSGRLPSTLAHLPLQEFHYGETELCVPELASFQAWLNGIASRRGPDVLCPPLPERDVLVTLYEATGGPNWARSDNWLTDTPLGEWYGVETDGSGLVVDLDLPVNNLAGTIPPELGTLGSLTTLDLGYNFLNGTIPAEFGTLESLKSLDLWQNNLTGTIPAGLGALANLEELFLNRNNLAGAIPAELGSLASLEDLYLNGNSLTGTVPGELGGLSNVEHLYLDNNDLAGPVPATFGMMSSLKRLGLTNNPRMEGPLPHELTALHHLEGIQAGATQLCAPPDPGFQAWLAGVHARRIVACASGASAAAYLTQAVQSREYPVPLVAGEKALLRVFVTAARATEAGIPSVRARFYVNGTETHVAETAAKTTPIPTKVVEGDLSSSANVEIPGEVVQPGLEMVIEIDPDGTLDAGLGVASRIPTTGRMPVDVRAMPRFDLTVIPFIRTGSQDSSVVDLIDAMAADPENHELLEETHTLLPVERLDVTAHEPVLTVSYLFGVLAETEAILAMEGGTGHYMGMMPYPGAGPAGIANIAGRASAAIPDGAVIAHELGHNMDLAHAPCGTFGDPSFPYIDGSVGAWGYDFRDGGRLVPPATRDLMSYCHPQWISDYSFTNALRYRLFDEGPPPGAAVAARTRSLLLWGGVNAGAVPFLEPAFVVDAPALLPDSAGGHWLTGHTASRAELFSISFTMPETADGDGNSSFAFILPVQPGWQDSLASITLSGPGGSVTLDGNSELPMAILRNPRTGQVRGFLRDLPQPDAAALTPQAGPDALDVLFSRGIPNAAAWNR